MLDFPRWKVWLVIATTVIGVIAAVPSMLPEATRDKLPGWLSKTHINLGLDLSGGSHLLLEADTADVRKQQIERMEETIRTEMRRASPKIEISDISTAGGALSFMPRNPAQLDQAVDIARQQTNGIGIGGQRDWNVAVRDSTRVVMTPTDAGIKYEIDSALETARNVVAKRIDPEGTKEITVVRQGADRILVQVPGLQDPEGLKRILGKTAKLEFKLVDLNADPNEVAAGRAPAGSQILPMQQGGKIAVKRRVMVSGDELNDARQDFGQNGDAVVSIKFNNSGGRKFGRVTAENVGKPFAIILDNVVISAPNINEPILGGSAQISGSFTVESANELAISLRSGKLPVALKVIEESSVSAELGQDSIQKGVLAGVLATLALVFYMMITYFRFGVYTTIALLVNALLVLGLMGIFNATLTLPGIAGFVLTIGAAVDANVLINERIREEVRRGRHTIQAVEFGFKEASTAIFDANITNVISAIILFWFGSGPIKGFAVVLALGIATSVFTGVTFTRLLVAQYLQRNRPKTLIL
ncbi:MAG: protein translocase subunit SecD [Chakrabartia godavariana]